MTILYILLAIFILGVLIMVHELGHYTAGRLLKFDIFEFAIGMGPKIFTRKKNGISYSLRAIPFGGFVAFDNEESIEKGELKFHKNPIWKRIIVILSGPLMNIITAVVLVIVFINIVGYPNSVLVTAGVNQDSPAYEAGLMVGDEFIEVDGKKTNGNMTVLQEGLQKGTQIDIEVKRDDELITLTVTPEYNEESQSYMIGIEVSSGMYLEEVTFFQSIGAGFKYSFNLIKQLLDFLFKLVTKGEGAGDVAGPVGSIGIIADTAKQYDFPTFLHLVAFISMNLGVFNLIPIPPLDGSKLILFGVEAVRRKPLSIEKEGMIQMIGFALFIVLAIVLTYKDIVRMVTGG